MTVSKASNNNQEGIKAYYQAKIEAAELTINYKTQNLRRLEAQRNALNARGMWRQTSLHCPNIFCSSTITGRATITSRAGQLCRGGSKGYGKE